MFRCSSVLLHPHRVLYGSLISSQSLSFHPLPSQHTPPYVECVSEWVCLVSPAPQAHTALLLLLLAGDWSKLGSSVSSRTLGERAVSHITGSPGIPSHGLLHMFTGAPRWFIGEEHILSNQGIIYNITRKFMVQYGISLTHYGAWLRRVLGILVKDIQSRLEISFC